MPKTSGVGDAPGGVVGGGDSVRVSVLVDAMQMGWEAAAAGVAFHYGLYTRQYSVSVFALNVCNVLAINGGPKAGGGEGRGGRQQTECWPCKVSQLTNQLL